MHMLYIDETGTQNDKEHFVLGGAIVHENDWKSINQGITNLKSEYFQTVYADLKGLRRSNHPFIDSGQKIKNHFYGLPKETLQQFRDRLFTIILNEKITYLAAIVNKKKHREKYINPDDPYVLSYEFLVERFDKYLVSKDSTGIIHIEHSNTNLKKQLERAHDGFVRNGTGFQKINNIIESCHFVYGPKNNFVQIADLFINAVSVKFNNNNSVLFDKYAPFIYSNENKCIDGYGIKYFPTG